MTFTVRDQALREALAAVQAERLEKHEEMLKAADGIEVYLGSNFADDDIGYSMAVRDCENAILKLISK